MKLFRNLIACSALALMGTVAPALATQQTITIGTAGAGNGDTLYSAFTKTNANFGELYSTRSYAPGNYYLPYAGVTPTPGSALAAGSAYCMPFQVNAQITVSELGTRIATAVASSNVQEAIYANNAATGLPTGNALAASPSFSGATAGNVTGVLTSNVQLSPGLYWACSASDSAVVLSTVGVSANWENALVGTPTLSLVTNSNTAAGLGVSFPVTFGTWPSISSVTLTQATSAAVRDGMLIFKVVSQP